LDKYVRYRMLRGEECDGNVIRNKMVKNYVWYDEIKNKLMKLSMDGENMEIERRKDDGKIFV
jgi:hypothetical protein